MEITEDWNRFDALQRELLRHLVESVHRSLVDAGVPPEKLPDLIAEIVFDICCAIDGSAVMRWPDGRIYPVLTFARDATQAELLSSGGGSWMHEYVHDAVKEYLKTKL